MPRIHFHVERPCAEACFAVGHFFGTMAGHEAEEVKDLAEFKAKDGAKVIYGSSAVKGALHVRPWAETGLKETVDIDPRVSDWQGVPTLFPVDGGDLPFDPVAGTFFHLTRAEEERLPKDHHGRPRTADMHAARHGYLHRPLVDEWLHAVHAHWRAKDGSVPRMERSYAQTVTMDADNGAMYSGRSLWRSFGGACRDLLKGHPERVRDRSAVLLRRAPDPYAVHDTFLALARQNDARPIINFIAAPRGPHDHAVPINGSTMKKVLASIRGSSEVGLHPGYESSMRPGSIAREKHLLEQALGGPVRISRQHFLRFRTPATQHELIACGILEDHSMGLADRAGFRASTCTPYPFFDRTAERVTALRIHPFAVMDSALAYGMRLSPTEAVQEAKHMVDAVRRVNGRFISVWHERFVSGYGDERGWETMAPEVIRYARP